MIRELLTPEAQSDPYIWAAVMLAHVAIGMMLRQIGLRLWVIAVAYAAWEALQWAVSGIFLPYDAILDWVAVMLGAIASGPAVAAAVVVVVLAGMGRRR